MAESRKEEAARPDVQTLANELVAQAREAAALFTQYDQTTVDRIVYAAARAGAERRLDLARMAVEETGMGVFEDKVIKNLFATEYIYNDIRDVRTVGLLRDDPRTGIMEYAEPLGVILGIIPVTNPTSTALFKCLIALKSRNAIVICGSRNANRCTLAAAQTIYNAAVAAGAPDYVIRWVEQPSRELTHALMSHPGMSLILATGGMSLVEAAYSSGTPAIGVGPGNVPAYICHSADLESAVCGILTSKTFDNGMICASEQAVVVDAAVAKEVTACFERHGAYFLKPAEAAKVEALAIDAEKKSMSPKVVGQPARRIAELAGVSVPAGTRVLMARLKGVGDAYPLSREKLCPILGFYTTRNLDEAVNLCTDLTHFGGLGHTVSLWSNDPATITCFGETVNAGRIVVNSPSSQGAIGDIYNRIRPSLTLGCGAGGQNITTDNVSVPHLLNIKRVARRMMNMKWFRVPSRIYFEAGALDTFFTHEIKDLGVKRALIVCSGSSVRQGVAARLETYLREAGIATAVFSDVQPDPTLETVAQGADAMRRFQPDLIIALGGGSPIDAAKTMWLLYENPDLNFEDLRLRFLDVRKRIVRYPQLGRKARLIAIPTTSGTGSEVTAFSVVTDSRSHTKYPLADYALTPDIAIIDPNLTLSVPPDVTADTGFDVLAHALEAYVSVMASDYTDPLALKAVQLVFGYLPAVLKDGRDARAREKMHNASTIAGLAFTNAFLGINHCLAHILGATFHIPHGRANALVMPAVIRYNAQFPPNKYTAFPNYPYPRARERYAEIAAVLGLEADTPDQGVASLVKAIADLAKTAHMPASIREAGVPEADFKAKLDFMAQIAFDDQCVGGNPCYPLVADLAALLMEAYG